MALHGEAGLDKVIYKGGDKMFQSNVKTIRNPEWLNLYDKFKDAQYDSIIPYDDLNACLMEGDIKDKKRFVFEKFKKELLHLQCKALENVRGVGYRVVNPNEHVRLTRRELKRSLNRAREGVDIILHVNSNGLNDVEKNQAVLIATRAQNLAATLMAENKAITDVEVKFRLPNQVPRVI